MAAAVGGAVTQRLFGRDADIDEEEEDDEVLMPSHNANMAYLSEDAAAFLRQRVGAKSPTTNSDEWQLLVEANERLRGQVADLTGALKARDMEIAQLRERCAFLAKAMEQQDETIAKIYAVASPDAVQAIQKQHDDNQATVDSPPATTTKTSPPPPPSIVKSTTAVTDTIVATASGLLNEAIDRILYPPRSTPPPTKPARRMSLFDDDPVATTDVDTSPSSCSSTLSSKSSSTRLFERRESSASEEDFAKSAGFLRRPSRRTMSGRLSITDFGLLDNNDEEEDADSGEGDESDVEDNNDDQDNQTQATVSPARSRSTLSRSRSEDLHSRRSRTKSASLRNLFADIDGAMSSKANAHKSNQDEATEEQEMPYAEFLERLRLPASRDILATIRLFLASILGPRGDGKPPRSTDFVDYDFYGTHEFRRRCTMFFQSMEELLMNHPLWHHASEATLTKARDGIEKYVMDKLSHIAMNQLDECLHWQEEDARLLRRMELLTFITPDMLDIKPCMRNEVVWSMAEDELRRINSFRCPGDKINCIVRCCSIIFSVLNLTRGDAGSRPGADDFLPVFIYIVLHSKIPRLYSNCEYISAYRNPNDLMSKAGYCFVNLRSALEFLSVVDASMLSISDEEFTKLYKQRERELPPLIE